MAETIERSLLDLDFASLTRRTFTPSPAAWEDQVLYFLLLDRFSDGNEKGEPRGLSPRPGSRAPTDEEHVGVDPALQLPPPVVLLGRLRRGHEVDPQSH